MSKLKSDSVTYSGLYFSLWMLKTLMPTRSLHTSKAVKYNTYISLEIYWPQQNLWMFTKF